MQNAGMKNTGIGKQGQETREPPGPYILILYAETK